MDTISLASELDLLIARHGLAAVRRELAARALITGAELRRRRCAIGVSALDVACAAARAGAGAVRSVQVRISTWERHDVAPTIDAQRAIVRALEQLEAAPCDAPAPLDRDAGAEFLSRWRALGLPVMRWAERASAEHGTTSPRSMATAIYAWAAGRGAPGAAVRRALVAALEGAEGDAAARAAAAVEADRQRAPGRGEPPPVDGPCSPPVRAPWSPPGLDFEGLLAGGRK